MSIYKKVKNEQEYGRGCNNKYTCGLETLYTKV